MPLFFFFGNLADHTMIKKAVKCLGAGLLSGSGCTGRYDARHRSVAILMYHRVNSDPGCLGLSVAPELFSRQLRFLKERYRVISLGEAVSRLATGSLEGNDCAITFDDGYLDNYEIAAPLLAEQNLPATVFVTHDAIETGFFGWGTFDRTLMTATTRQLDLQEFGLGLHPLDGQEARKRAIVTLHKLLKQRPDSEKLAVVDFVVSRFGDGRAGERTMMNWSQLRELAAGGLVTIGAHTVTHPILSRVSPQQASREVCEGKRLIEAKLGRAVDYFAYPNGLPADIGPDVLQLVRESGYLGACTTIPGRNAAGCDPLYLKRLDVTTHMSTGLDGRFSPGLFSTMISGFLYRNRP
jgi:peptidoglycan/xylan/chitin deacetylase (PgdA/CDA1 family)